MKYWVEIREWEWEVKVYVGEFVIKEDGLGKDIVVVVKNNVKKVFGKKLRKYNIKSDVEGDLNGNGYDEFEKECYKEVEDVNDFEKNKMDIVGDVDVNEGFCFVFMYGGVLWDIFRWEDVFKLKEYLLKYVVEFCYFDDKFIDCVSMMFFLVLVCDLFLLVVLVEVFFFFFYLIFEFLWCRFIILFMIKFFFWMRIIRRSWKRNIVSFKILVYVIW